MDLDTLISTPAEQSEKKRGPSLFHLYGIANPMPGNRSLTYGQGFLVYYLMRGGIDDPLAIEIIAGLDRCPTIQTLERVYLWFDNTLAKHWAGKQPLPSRATRCKVYCASCGTGLSYLPCDCGLPVALTLDAERRSTLGKEWEIRDDRNWKGMNRIMESERTYHGGYRE